MWYVDFLWVNVGIPSPMDPGECKFTPDGR